MKTSQHTKVEFAKDYVVPPLEGLWWADDWASFTTARNKNLWSWTMMILRPNGISVDVYQRALNDVQHKKHLPSLDKMRMEVYQEGLCVHILHVGSYDDEAPVLGQRHQNWLPQHGYTEHGKHHEIYLIEKSSKTRTNQVPAVLFEKRTFKGGRDEMVLEATGKLR